MAGPLLAIAAAASITGGVLNAFGQASAFQEQKATTKYNKAILDANDRIDQSLIEMNQRRIREEGEELLGEQRAFVGASGTKFSGSNIDVFMDTVRDIELDVISLDIQKMIGSAKTSQQKSLLDMSLASSKKALPLKIASSLLGGVTSAASISSGNIAESATSGSGSAIHTSVGSGVRKGMG